MASLLKKKTGVKLQLLIDIDMLLMVEKGIKGGTFQAIHRYAKGNNKYMESYDKNIESSYLIYLDANNFYGWTMPQKLPANGFEWVKKLSKFDKRFIKNYHENNDNRYFLEVDVEYLLSICLIFIAIYHFYLKSKNGISFFVTFMIRKTMLFT